jgi:hypothetical protein
MVTLVKGLFLLVVFVFVLLRLLTPVEAVSVPQGVVLPIYLPLIRHQSPGTFTVTTYSQMTDGEMGKDGCISWDACRNGEIGTLGYDSEPYGTVGASRDSAGYQVKRLFLFFDTSAIPSDAIIQNAVLHLYAYTYQAGIVTLHVVPATANSPLIYNTDFGQIEFVSGGSATPQPDNWVDISLQPSAFSWIGGDITKLALIHDLDLNNSTPVQENWLTVALAEQSQQRPYLVEGCA